MEKRAPSHLPETDAALRSVPLISRCLPLASIAVSGSLSFGTLPIKSLLPLHLTLASVFDALAADIDDDDDLLLTLFPLISSAFGESHLESFTAADGDTDVNVVTVAVTGVVVVGDCVAVASIDFDVPIVVAIVFDAVFADTLLSSDRIDCNVFALLLLLFAWRSHASNDFVNFCARER